MSFPAQTTTKNDTHPPDHPLMPRSLARRFADPPLARIAIACGVLLSVAVRAVASPAFREGRVLVGYVDGVAGGRHARIASVVGATDVGAIGAHTRVLRVRPGREMATIHALRARHDVRYAEPDWIGHADALPDAIVRELFPLALIVTPNLAEATCFTALRRKSPFASRT